MALARKISNGSSRDLPPSYSKVRNNQNKISKLLKLFDFIIWSLKKCKLKKHGEWVKMKLEMIT